MDMYAFAILLLIVCGLASASGSCPRDVDPCSNDTYIEMNQPSRSTNYTVTNINENDYTLSQRWYHSVSGAGGDMPTQMVYTGQCNAYAPIWLNGELPSTSDGIVDVPACASFLEDTCIRQYTIPVKNCGTYRVYCLSPVLDAYDRYCMGSELACPEGQISPTGFTPGCTGETTESGVNPTYTPTTQMPDSTTPPSTNQSSATRTGSSSTTVATTSRIMTIASTTNPATSPIEVTTTNPTAATEPANPTNPTASLTPVLTTQTGGSSVSGDMAHVSSTPTTSETAPSTKSSKNRVSSGNDDSGSDIIPVIIGCTVSIVAVIIIVGSILGCIFLRRNRPSKNQNAINEANAKTFNKAPPPYSDIQDDAASRMRNCNMYTGLDPPPLAIYEKPLQEHRSDDQYAKLHHDIFLGSVETFVNRTSKDTENDPYDVINDLGKDEEPYEEIPANMNESQENRVNK